MSQADSNLEFKVTVPIEKSSREDGWYITGIAAGAGHVDKAGDMMLPSAIEVLAAQINDSPVPFRNQHKRDDIMEDLGEVVKAEVTDDFELRVEVRLDQDNPAAAYLWNKLGQGKQYGMSVRGDTERPIIEKAQKGYTVKHHTVHLKEVSVTTRPYYTHSLGTVLRKAIDEADYASLAIGENTNMADSVTGEAPAQESSAPENDTAQDVSPSEELVKSLMADDEFKTLITDTVKAAIAEAAPVEEATDSVEDNTEVEKSESEDASAAPSDMTEIVKSITAELNESFDSKINALLERIADVSQPAILEKSEAEEAKETLEAFKNSDPRNRLRVGLAGKHGQLDRL